MPAATPSPACASASHVRKPRTAKRTASAVTTGAAARTASCDKSSQLGVVLSEPAHAQGKQPNLQRDERVRLVVQRPDEPQDVASDETPESNRTLATRLRRYEPRSGQGYDHRGPLQGIQKLVHHRRERSSE